MADEADRADLLSTELLTRAIAELRAKTKELNPTGECYNCSAMLPEGLRFCDADCRDDYTKRQRI